METILRNELEAADKRIIALENTIEAYKGLVKAQETRIDMLEKSHAFELENYYIKK